MLLYSLDLVQVDARQFGPEVAGDQISRVHRVAFLLQRAFDSEHFGRLVLHFAFSEAHARLVMKISDRRVGHDVGAVLGILS